MIRKYEQDDFEYLVGVWVLNPKEIRWAVGRALDIPSIDEIVAQYKDGWLGDRGRFARIVARCLSQIE